MPDSTTGAPIQPKSVIPPPNMHDRGEADSKTGSDGSDQKDTKGSADKGFIRLALTVWLGTIVAVGVVVVAYFMVHPTAGAFTETVLGIIIAGVVSCGFGFRFVYNIHNDGIGRP